MSYSVLICDDDPQVAADYVEQIQKIARGEYTFQRAPSMGAVRESVTELLRRQKLVRAHRPLDRRECVFDNTDILIVDYDLIHVDDENARHTGEGIGRLARIYSDCAVVVVFNQFAQFDFDLSLRGHLTSHADLNLNDDFLATAGLWNDPPWSGFRPWSWQVFSRAVASQKAREAAFGCDLDRSIVDTLDMCDDDAMGLSDTAFGFLGPKAEEFDGLQEVTFRSFISTQEYVRDTQSLLLSDVPAAVRFGAARIGKWLEREVLGPQDVLTDVPHLLQRFPFLLGNDVSSVEAWNLAIHEPKFLEGKFDSSYWFEPATCLSRRAVWCRRLEADKDFNKARFDFNYSTVPDFVFMEDASCFLPFSEGRQFRAGFHNFFDRRLVKEYQGVRYGPQRRFAFALEM